MKIWFDITNSPHVNMFHDLIKELEEEGHEIVITCRPLANTIELLDQKRLKFTIIGKHYGKNLFRKVFGFPIRVYQLWAYLKSERPDVAVSQSSFHSPLVSKLLGISCIYTNDNEHALGNLGCFFLATKVLIPESMNKKKAMQQGASRKRIVQYPGIKEGIYLWKKGELIHKYRVDHINPKVKIFIRPEPNTAQYYTGGINFLDPLLESLQHKYLLTVLCRTAEQLTHYTSSNFSSIEVPTDPLEFINIANECSLFIGAGGSMTRELAILGIPTISVYQDKLLEVDKLLVGRNLLLHMPDLNEENVHDSLARLKNKEPDLDLMVKGKMAYLLFKKEILQLPYKGQQKK